MDFPRPRLQKMRLLAAFTLLELLAAFSVLALLLVLVFSLISQVTKVTTTSTSSFQDARTAFETMTRLLSQAVLNTYWDYDNSNNPVNYIRASELHYVMGDAATLTGLTNTLGNAVFFQAPLGKSKAAGFRDTPALLNSVGFYVRYSASPDLPSYLQNQPTEAYRLWMYLQPSEEFKVYDIFNGNPQKDSDLSWFRDDITDAARNHVLANNVILLLIRCSYEDADGKMKQSYAYDSRPPSGSGSSQPVEKHQIPPTLHVTLVAIDDVTAIRLRGLGSYNPIGDIPFTDAAEYKKDIGALQSYLNSRPLNGIPINYRIFESTINVSSSKWSK